MEEKSCSCCKQVKSLSEFHKQTQGKDGVSSLCKLCSNSRRIEWSKAHKHITKNTQLLWRHGITLKEYKKLLKKQKGVCAICGNVNRRGFSLAVDHDHLTGEIRGLLCSNCNPSIGYMCDNPFLLRKAADYLEGR